MTSLTVTKKKTGPIHRGHPWVFSGALAGIPEGLKTGDPVRLVDEDGTFLAMGYFNSYSQIAVRIWSYEDEAVNEEFFEKRVLQAADLRKSLIENDDTNAYRLINSENDFLPGLIVDKYADYLVVQFHTRGIETWKQQIVDSLVNNLKPAGIYERSQSRSRTIEQAEKQEGLLYGAIPQTIEIKENGILYLVNIKEGQKTGFFLDQRDKREALKKYASGKKVLNCFSYTGGFSLSAILGGASSVVSVDVSRPALETAEENAKLNRVDESKMEYILADAKEYLADLPENAFDLIVLDPPAFIKDRRKVKEGLRGYRSINQLAIEKLPPNGLLLTCSCSAHLTAEDFRFMLSEAAARANRRIQIIETFGHGIDHPELPAFKESSYLKCFFVRVL